MVRRAPVWLVRELLLDPTIAAVTISYGGYLKVDDYYGRTPLELAVADLDWFNQHRSVCCSMPDAERSAEVISVLMAGGLRPPIRKGTTSFIAL